MKSPQEIEDEIIKDVAGFTHDPLGYVHYAYPWGENELDGHEGPMPWACEVYNYIGERLRYGAIHGHQPILIAVASGHGITKSATAAQLIDWGLSTCEDTRIIVTANTAAQLATKTWPELAKWHRLAINKDWFLYTATALTSTQADHDRTWRADALPWTENRSEAFAGLHNKKKRIIVIFDEASAISDKIWEVTEGALTDDDTEIIWVAFGNPTRNTGRFHACFHSLRHLWKTWQVDSRSVSTSNKKQIQTWLETYGIDSDFVKVRVLGQFPNASVYQFIPADLVTAARGKHLQEKQYDFAPVIITVDPSWTGEDEFVIAKRQGLAFSILKTFQKNDDDFRMAGIIAQLEDEHKADAVFIDQGYGTGIFSAGKAMGREWMLVNFGDASDDPGYFNKRAQMWGEMKKWLQQGGAIPDDQVLANDLIGPEAQMRTEGKIQLERKEDMKKRGIPSPNRADALALSFAYPVMKRSHRPRGQQNFAVGTRPEDYNALA